VSPLSTVPLLALPIGAITYACIRRWPHRDPLAPHLAPTTVVEGVRRHARVRALVRSRLDPTTETGLLLTVAVGVVVVSVTGFGVILEMVRSNRGLAFLRQLLRQLGGEERHGVVHPWIEADQPARRLSLR
jgi:hypothetical protein